MRHECAEFPQAEYFDAREGNWKLGSVAKQLAARAQGSLEENGRRPVVEPIDRGLEINTQVRLRIR